MKTLYAISWRVVISFVIIIAGLFLADKIGSLWPRYSTVWTFELFCIGWSVGMFVWIFLLLSTWRWDEKKRLNTSHTVYEKAWERSYAGEIPPYHVINNHERTSQ